MLEPSVLIITTGHDLQDGRLVRHQRSLLRAGVTVNMQKVGTRSRFSRFFVGPITAYRLIKKSHANCVILPDPELQLSLPPILHKKIVVISDVHENYEQVLFDRVWIRKSMIPFVKVVIKILQKIRDRWSHVVVTVDESIARDEYVIISNRPNPVDLPRPSESPAVKRLVYVGDIRESRGLSAMLQLAKETPDVGLDLVGPCDNAEKLQKQIKDLSLSDRVKWHGRCTYDQSWEIARHCLSGLSLLSSTPSFRNAIPTKIWEYWAVGLPILAFDVPAQSKIIFAAHGGVVGTQRELKETLDIWLENPHLARNVGVQGREYLMKEVGKPSEGILDAVQKGLQKFEKIKS